MIFRRVSFTRTYTWMAWTHTYTSWNKSRTIRTSGRTYPGVCGSTPQSRLITHLVQWMVLASAPHHTSCDLDAAHHTAITPYHSPLSAQGEGSYTNTCSRRAHGCCYRDVTRCRRPRDFELMSKLSASRVLILLLSRFYLFYNFVK